MQKFRTQWSRTAGHHMIDKGVTSADIAAGTGLDKRYVASVIYGRVDSPRARKKISDFLGISDSEYPDD